MASYSAAFTAPKVAHYMPHIHISSGDHAFPEAYMAAARDWREEAHRLVDQLPPDASWDDLMYEVYVRQAVEAGLADAETGRVVAHEEAVARLRSRP
jgi:hypothetical protein